jgi:hypothetical protein
MLDTYAFIQVFTKDHFNELWGLTIVLLGILLGIFYAAYTIGMDITGIMFSVCMIALIAFARILGRFSCNKS